MKRGVTAILILTAAGLPGCAGTRAQQPAPPPVAPGLVLQTPGLADRMQDGDGLGHPGHWEFARNDRLLGSIPTAPAEETNIVVERSRQRLYTTNGRPNEYSTYSTSVIRRRYGR